MTRPGVGKAVPVGDAGRSDSPGIGQVLHEGQTAACTLATLPGT